MTETDGVRSKNITNLWQQIANPSATDEFSEILATGQNVRVERIVSNGHCSDDDFWYDSDQAEWVAVLSGEARLRFKDQNQQVRLRTGDHITIAPHDQHRVEWTTPDEPTVWLAVYFSKSRYPSES